MKIYKLLVRELTQEDQWGYNDKDAVKLGEVVFPYKGKIDDEEVGFTKGQKLYYQYGNKAVFNGEELVVVSLNSLVKEF